MKYKFKYQFHGHVDIEVEAENAEKAMEEADIKLDYIPAETIIRDALWTTRLVSPVTTDPVNYPYRPD